MPRRRIENTPPPIMSDTNLKQLTAILEAQATNQRSITTALRAVSEQVGQLNSILELVVNEIRDGLPVPNPNLDEISQMLEKSKEINADMKETNANMMQMAQLTGEMLALLKTQLESTVPDPPEGFGRRVN